MAALSAARADYLEYVTRRHRPAHAGAHPNAVLQHVDDAAAVLRQARRVGAPGAVIGVGDADWGSRIVHPHDPPIVRGQEIQEAVREAGNVRVGRELRGDHRIGLGAVGGGPGGVRHQRLVQRGRLGAVVG